eukprot:scaffold15625_cov2241-Alexandrium_tamarense.AAC.1
METLHRRYWKCRSLGQHHLQQHRYVDGSILQCSKEPIQVMSTHVYEPLLRFRFLFLPYQPSHAPSKKPT